MNAYAVRGAGAAGIMQARSQGEAMGAIAPPQFRKLHQKFLGQSSF